MSEVVRKSFKYRLYPNKEQQSTLQWTIDRCRELYNAALDERRSVAPRFFAYRVFGTAATLEVDEIKVRSKRTTPEKPRLIVKAKSKARAMRSVTKYSQSRELTEIKHDIRSEYQNINDHILRNVLERADLAFQAFFRRCKAGETPGYPRFQGKNRYDSFTTDSGFKIQDGRLSLQNIGSIRVKLHRPIEGKIKTCTVKQEGIHWYVTFSCEVEPALRQAYTDEIVGIDLGVNPHFAALSTGDTIPHPRFYRRTEKRLEKAQQELSRKSKARGKSKGKNETRRQKAVKQVAKLHRKIARQRKDFLHKQSRQLVDTYEVLVFEDLQAANLTKKPKPKQDEETGHYLPNNASAKAGLNKSILDAGWGMFIQYCSYKAEWAGRAVLQVDPKYTSQICSGCGTVVKKDLSERWHSCECGCELDRDVNAAINIRTLSIQEIERCHDLHTEHSLSQTTNEAGSASASVSAQSPQRKRPKRAAEPSPTPTLSQDGLWAGP